MTGITGAGLFDLRSLSTDSLLHIYSTLPLGDEAEDRMQEIAARILRERGELD